MKTSKIEQSIKESIKPPDPQAILDATYELLMQEAQKASYSEYSVEKLSSGKFGIAELGKEKEQMFVMLSDRLYTQYPHAIGWAYELRGGTFSFELQTGERHDTCRIIAIENTSTEKALLRFNNFIEDVCHFSANPTKKDNQFIDGIWFAVQHMVIVRDIPSIAAGIFKEADLAVSDCMEAQKRNRLFDIQMRNYQSELRKFKYWLRINGYRLNQFGTGEIWNPIKIKSNIKSKKL